MFDTSNRVCFTTAMNTSDLEKVFGTQVAIAAFLGISRAAVSQWGESVPELRQYQLRERMPNIDTLIATVKESAAQS